jgi:uncharacterized membrane protein
VLNQKILKSEYLNLSLLCLVVFLMAGLRAIYSGTLTNLFVYWNVFLALAAFAFIKLFNILNSNTKLKGWLKNIGLITLFLGWLSLIPNAIYLVTDIGHLNGPRLVENSRYNPYKKKVEPKREVPYIYDVVMLFLLALIGFISSGMLTNKMFDALKKTELKKHIKFKAGTELAYLSLVSLASAVAVFLGRYLRWNSWDLIINPINILKDLYYYFTHPLSTPNLYLIIILFFILVALAHRTLKFNQ